MLSDGTWTYSWERGRRLDSMTNGSTTWSYTYNNDGMRVRRTDGTNTYTYFYNGDRLRCMDINGSKMYFVLDASGKPIELSYTPAGTSGWQVYYYVTNLQGDVTAILNPLGAAVVRYTYDAWGNVLSITGHQANTLGVLNPFRYRGYVYDTETELYYCNSRYYNPEIGRFINADTTDILTATPMGLTDKNLFAYCDNNPVIRADHGGEFWHLIVGAVVGVATQYISDVVSNLSEGKSFMESLKPSSTWADYGSAALSGALAASGVGLVVSVAANAALGGATYMANCAIKGEDANIVDLSLSTGIGAVSGFIGGSGANGAKLRGVASTSKQVLKTTVSPKKVAMYTAKIANVKKTVIVSTVRTMVAGFSANYLNNKRKGLTNSIA